jgi:predicted ATPase
MVRAAGAEIRLFGAPRVLIEGRHVSLGAPPRTLQLLAYLAIADGKCIPRETIAEALWPEMDSASSRASLRRHLHHLREALSRLAIGATVVKHRGALGVVFDESVFVDVREFERALARGDDAAAVGLHTDHLLATVEEEWVFSERNRIVALASEAANRAIADARRRGSAADLLALLGRAIALQPWREELVREMMQLQFDRGDRAGALSGYRSFERYLRDELQTAPVAETRALFEQLAQAFPAVRASAPAAELTRFIGRQREVDAVVRVLDDDRFVTLTGPPGVGKTRIAKRVLHLVANEPRYRDGSVFLDIGVLEDPAAIETALAAASAPAAIAGTLDDAVCGRAMLLVIDNCERLHDACARLCERLLNDHPGIVILTTSRRVLNAPSESVFRIDPLPLPDEHASTEAARASDAVALFVDRACSARVELRGADFPLAAAGTICRQLEGIPLAIELAAARLRTMGIDQLSAMLDQRFRLLKRSGARVDHQHSLATTYAWSFDLLSERERVVFARLSVFAGGFTLEAAAAVGYDNGDIWLALDDISSLVDQSLLVPPDAADSARRYRFLDSIRQYAEQRLIESGTERDARDAHARFYAQQYTRLADELRGPRAHTYFPELEIDYPNVRRALSHLIDDAADLEAGMRLALAVSRYWTDRGRAAEESPWLERALATGAGDPVLRADAFQCLANITRNFGDYHRAFDLHARRLEVLRAAGDPTAIGKAMATLSNAARILGRFEEALQYAREAAMCFSAADDRYLVAYARTASAVTHLSRASIDEAVADFNCARDEFEALGAVSDAALATLNLGLCAHYACDDESAAKLCRAGLERANEIGSHFVAAHGYQNLATIEIARGDRDAALQYVAEALEHSTLVGDQELRICSLESYAAYEYHFGSVEDAAIAMMSADLARFKYHAARFPVDEPSWDALSRAIRERAGEATFRSAETRDRVQSLDRAIDDARDKLASLVSTERS